MQQAAGWWGLLFSMAERQLSLMSRLSPTTFQFTDTLGTTLFRSSNKDGFLLSRVALSAEEEKAVLHVTHILCQNLHEHPKEDIKWVSVHFKMAATRVLVMSKCQCSLQQFAPVGGLVVRTAIVRRGAIGAEMNVKIWIQIFVQNKSQIFRKSKTSGIGQCTYATVLYKHCARFLSQLIRQRYKGALWFTYMD